MGVVLRAETPLLQYQGEVLGLDLDRKKGDVMGRVREDMQKKEAMVTKGVL